MSQAAERKSGKDRSLGKRKNHHSQNIDDTNGEQRSKKPRKDKPADGISVDIERNPPKSSLLQTEERAFPRGGANVLTPLERKQIQIQATKDVLFEESGQSKPPNDENDDGLFSDPDQSPSADPQSKKSSKKRKLAKNPEKSAKPPRNDAEPRVHTHGLKFKRLVAGSMILGQVSRITPNHVTVDLPNGLTGNVYPTAISQALSQKLESMAVADENESDGESGASIDDRNFELPELFSKGQYLRTYVTSTTDQSSNAAGKTQKKIELSVDPRLVNQGISKHDIAVNVMLQASVVSVEDHGLVMDLGLSDASTKAFMSSKEIPENMELGNIKEGMVFLCLVASLSSNGTVIKLSANSKKIENVVKASSMSLPPSVKTLLPGMAVEVLVSHVSTSSISGQIMGSVKASADIMHAGQAKNQSIESSFKEGDKVKARILFSIPSQNNYITGISTSGHILSLSTLDSNLQRTSIDPLEALPLSSTVETAKILSLDPHTGLFLDVGVKGVPAFVHISRLSDGTVESLSAVTGPFKLGTIHRARVVGYNALDGVFVASMEKSVLDQKYLRLEDIPIGESVEATVIRIIVNSTGVAGLQVNLAKGINAFVPETHMSDIHLQHPERKFKEGSSLKARVLSVDSETRQVVLTLKKTLVASENPVWKDYSDISLGAKCHGTIVSTKPEGAIVKFFGNVRAFLPVSEVSDAFVEDLSKHFRIGQTVNVYVISVDPNNSRMTVSCRIPSEAEAATMAAFSELHPGQLVDGTVTAISGDDISLELKDTKCRANLRIGHLTDGSEQKNSNSLKQIRIGQTLQKLLIVETFNKNKSVVLSNKPSLVKDAQEDKLVTTFDQLVPHMQVHGYVKNITEEGLFVALAGRLTGLLHRSHLPQESIKLVDFGYRRDQSISAYVSYLDYTQSRFTLTLEDPKSQSQSIDGDKPKQNKGHEAAVQPIDGESNSLGDFTLGKITSAKVTSVKSSQLNVQLASNVNGRIDASEAFHNWDDIKDRKNPLNAFRRGRVIPVRILGIHDARNHRFLPITHRSGNVPVFELSVKLDVNASILSLDQVKLGSWYTAFVNNSSDSCLWVNLSPNVRGRIERMDISEDVSLLNDLEANFPVGTALRVRAKNVDLNNGHLDLSARADTTDQIFDFDSLSSGVIVGGRVTKVTERSVLVQLGPSIVGAIGLTDLADDFTLADPSVHNKNDIVKVSVLEVDRPNKKIFLSTRPSKVLSSSLKVVDKHISSLDQLHVNDRVRGFVKNVANSGVFLSLSHNITAFVRVSELSDSYIKDWKSAFEIDRLVTGKIISIDPASNHIQMSLKDSVVRDDYVPRLTFNDLTVGQVITGKIRKVEDFGAFIVVDNSHNVSGLCHRSEMAKKPILDARKIYAEGDNVKAIVLKIDPEKRRVTFGMKASYFESISDEDEDDDEEPESDVSAAIENEEMAKEEDSDEEEYEDSDEVDGGVDVRIDAAGRGQEDSDEEMYDASEGLDAGGFDWTGGQRDDDNASLAASEPDDEPQKARENGEWKSNGVDLDAEEPQSASDFERRLLGQRDSSSLWVQYMAFHLQLSEIDEARKVAERALHEISIREQEEKLNVWVAYLNLENAYGTEDTIEEVFNRACEVQDAQEIHERLTSIYIESDKLQKADDLFLAMTKKKTFTPDPKLWLNYATFLIDTQEQPDRGRNLLDRAMQSVPVHLHRDLISKFAQLEFKCNNGDPERGRTMFERLLDTYPKRWDLWDVLVDIEKKQGEDDKVRDLYERMTSLKMKSRRAQYAFRKWLEFEEGVGNAKRIDHVKAKAAEFVEKQKG